MSNKMGTHLGYCIYFKKPHYLFSQDVNYMSCSRLGDLNRDARDKEEKESLIDVENIFKDNFGDTPMEFRKNRLQN